MSRRTSGVIFIAIGSFLYTTRFFSAAIWGSGYASWSTELFSGLLGYVDQGLTTWSIIAVMIGVIYLFWGEIFARNKDNQ
jgi:hypothetical protein